MNAKTLLGRAACHHFQHSKPIKKSNGPANSEPSLWSTVTSKSTYINPPVLAPSKTLVDKSPCSKEGLFCLLWSTIVSGISMKGQRATLKKKVAFGVIDEKSAGSWSSDESMEGIGC